MAAHPELTGYGGDLGPAAGAKVPKGATMAHGKQRNCGPGPSAKGGYDSMGMRESSKPGIEGVPTGKAGPKTSSARATGDGSQSTAVNVGSGAFTEGP